MPAINKACKKCKHIFEVWESSIEKCNKKMHECPKCKCNSRHARTYINNNHTVKKFGKVVPGYEKNPLTGEMGTSLGARVDARHSKWV